MGWVRLDDRITEHPKVAAAGPFGFAMFVAALAYSNRNLTDGFIPRSVAATLLDDEWMDFEGVAWKAAAHSGHQTWDLNCIDVADHLVDVGLFERLPVTGDVTRYGFQIHDYESYQPSRAEVLASRDKTARRVQRHRDKRTVEPDPVSQGNAVGNGVTNSPVTASPTPTPTVRTKPLAGRERNPIWDALTDVFGEPSTDTARSLRGKVCASLTRAGATHDEVVTRAKSWPRHFENATLTELALEKHWDALGRKPLRMERR